MPVVRLAARLASKSKGRTIASTASYGRSRQNQLGGIAGYHPVSRTSCTASRWQALSAALSGRLGVMAGGNSGAVAAGSRGWLWDVALSFAGAQRDYVERVAAALKAREIRCFYDADEQIDLWGKYLAEELPAIYGEQSAAVVVFVSADYAARDWTRLERRTALDRAVRERREYVLPARFDDTRLPGLLSGMVAVDLRGLSPEQFAGRVAAKLAALGITGPTPGPGNVLEARPPGAVRVTDADLRRLGVHAAISAPGVPDEVPPEYVPRDTDADEHGVRAKIAAAAQQGGFMLLTGGSSVGKTRCAAEAVKALLPDWWLIHPDGPAEVAALSAAPPARTVIWLDELQRYLDSEHGLAGSTVRALLNASGPVVIIGTLWPDRYAAYTAVPASGGPDPRAREREVLGLAAVIRISPGFSAAEQDRARDAARRDPRLATAVNAEGYGLTQTLAAAPQLVARWEDAREANPYAWAVMTAALDAARLGARSPLTPDFLRAAAPGYCTPAQQADAPGNWFEQALAYATAKMRGAAAALSPVSTGIMGQVAGYTTADYLLQHATRERQAARVPASTWDAMMSHIHGTGDAGRLADSARRRLLYRYALPLYQSADAGDWSAAGAVADLLARRGDLDELRSRAAAGDEHAAMQLADLFARHGDLDELRRLADTGDVSAATLLAGQLAQHGDLDEAIQILRRLADTGDVSVARQLADLLARQLVEVLASRADLDELRSRAAAGDWNAARRLAGLLAERGDLDELRTRADAGDWNAVWPLADLLARRGDLDEAIEFLRGRADAGVGFADIALTDLLAERGDLDELRTRADAGDWSAAGAVADLLARRGDLDEAIEFLRGRADAGVGLADIALTSLLAELGDLDELRSRAGAGDGTAATLLASLLAGRGNLDEAIQVLRRVADTGSGDGNISQLADLLTQQGHGEEAERLHRYGLNPDGSTASG